MFDEMSFTDSLAYVTLIDQTYYFPPSDWWNFEPLSKLMFLVLRELTGNVDASVAGGHYFINIVYLVGCLAIFPPSQGNWRGLLVAFAIFGPQLAFVTIRATPAYMLAVVGVLDAVRGRHRAFAWIGAATLFHISGVLALVPAIALLFRSHFEVVRRLQEPRVLLTLLFVMSAIFAIASSFLFSTAETILENIPFLSKYKVFLVGLSDNGGMSKLQGSSIGHFIFLIGTSIFFFFYITIKDPITRPTAIFVVAGYVLYSLMFFAFSPIAAFRQTPFWLLPAFSLFPWHRLGWTGPGQIPFLGGLVGVFLFQFVRVLS